MCKFNLKVLFLIAQLFICYLITLVWYAWPRGRSFSVGNFINHMQIQLKFQDLYLYSFTFSKAGNVSGPGQLWSRGLFDGCGLNPTGSHKDNCNIITVVWLGNICKHCILFYKQGMWEMQLHYIHARAYFTCTLQSAPLFTTFSCSE